MALVQNDTGITKSQSVLKQQTFANKTWQGLEVKKMWDCTKTVSPIMQDLTDFFKA